MDLFGSAIRLIKTHLTTEPLVPRIIIHFDENHSFNKSLQRSAFKSFMIGVVKAQIRNERPLSSVGGRSCFTNYTATQVRGTHA